MEGGRQVVLPPAGGKMFLQQKALTPTPTVAHQRPLVAPSTATAAETAAKDLFQSQCDVAATPTLYIYMVAK